MEKNKLDQLEERLEQLENKLEEVMSVLEISEENNDEYDFCEECYESPCACIDTSEIEHDEEYDYDDTDDHEDENKIQ